MDVELFNFNLTEDRIALRPVSPRDSAKLLQVKNKEITNHNVSDLPAILQAGDVLVLNETKVLRASLQGVRPARSHGGGGDISIGINLHKCISSYEWRAFVRPAKRLKNGDIIHISPHLQAEVFDKKPGGDIGLKFNLTGVELDREIEKCGVMPLPPYIAKQRAVDAQDDHDYQTIFGVEKGSVAAPTAGLHFTPELFAKLSARGVEIARLTLHVGAGTFLPVSHGNTDEHIMHAEWFCIDETTAAHINKAKAEGRRIIPVGTTACGLWKAVSEKTES